MPGASAWSIIFFLMLVTLGLDSSVSFSFFSELLNYSRQSTMCRQYAFIHFEVLKASAGINVLSKNIKVRAGGSLAFRQEARWQNLSSSTG